MLQEASHDGADVHAVGLALDARQQARDAADDHLHLHAGAAGLGNLVDDLAVGERVELEEHAGGLACLRTLDLAVETAQDEGLKARGRHAQVAVIALEVAQREVAEEQVCILADAGMCGHKHEVRVELGSLLVKVAGAQERETRERHALAIGDLADLGVALKAFGTIDDGTARLFQTFSPLDVVLLVKAGAQLHEDGDFLAVLRRVDQALAQAALLGYAVERDADGDAILVKGRLMHKVQQWRHGLIGVHEEFIALEHLLAHGAGGVDIGVLLWLKRGE